MKIEILKQSGSWRDAYFAMRKTQNPKLKYSEVEEPNIVIRRRMLYARHSPLKMVRYLIECEIHNKTQNHLVRHNSGVNWFVSTLRSDLKDIQDIEVTRVTMRKIVFEINAIAILHIYKVRSCQKAEFETVVFANELKKKIKSFELSWDFEPLWTNPCLDCREVAFIDCKGYRLPDDFFKFNQ